MIHAAEHAGSSYHRFQQPKKSGGSRTITAPSKELKAIQRLLKKALLDDLALPDNIVGGVPGRSIMDHAAFHNRQPVVVALDLASFFPSVSHARVHEVWHEVFGVSKRIGWILTRIATFDGALPQGAPTSTPLANLSLLPLHHSLHELLDPLRVRFSFWVDDLALSGARAPFALPLVEDTIERHGFAVAHHKTEVMYHWKDRQLITGLVVNHSTSRPRPFRKELHRVIAHLAREPDPPEELLRSLQGQVAFTRQVKRNHADALQRMLARVAIAD